MKPKPEPIPCTLESLGYYFEGEDGKRLTDIVNDYLSCFIAPCDCILCGYPIGGIMGTFTWDLTRGEGFCGKCKWPARGIHDIKDTDKSDIFNQPLRLGLLYHPVSLSDEFFEQFIKLQVFQSDIDRINEIRNWKQKTSCIT